jgi:hypothetical protein
MIKINFYRVLLKLLKKMGRWLKKKKKLGIILNILIAKIMNRLLIALLKL